MQKHTQRDWGRQGIRLLYIILFVAISVMVMKKFPEQSPQATSIDLVQPWIPGEAKIGVVTQFPEEVIPGIGVVPVQIIESTRQMIGAFVSLETSFVPGDTVEVTLGDTYFQGNGDRMVYHFAQKKT